MKGECYKNKFHPTLPQCSATEVRKRPPIGNATDDWTWCDDHYWEIMDAYLLPVPPRDEGGWR